MFLVEPRQSSVVSHMAVHRRWALLDTAGGLCAECTWQLRTAVMEYHGALYLYYCTRAQLVFSESFFPMLVVVVVVFTLTDRASTIPSNIRG